MAIYYRFKSAKQFDSIPVEGPFITVSNLKRKVFERKRLERGTDFDLLITNAQTNEEYLDEGSAIFRNTAVLIRRVPGLPRKPIIVERAEKPAASGGCIQHSPPSCSDSRGDAKRAQAEVSKPALTVGDLPELCCPLCKQVMENAVFARKCCFRSFCDKCIREHVSVDSTCECGAPRVLAEDFIPNKTLRDIVTSMLESAKNIKRQHDLKTGEEEGEDFAFKRRRLCSSTRMISCT
ncbi:E3 ubiquitin ligase PARAQUAT TOLERANCE 3-like [Asparagus officinalis]|uniref:E3 ubiquitin ligase PARAQUAT TOLERANCE 3-like n=1 Tax=Asparagus officinalis TaxID=4686 RepID=UPI00098E4835|nr:E3 ubiquitin ligase PARAQUAT TOLERANCE 3-like [Asparagus officinalis]